MLSSVCMQTEQLYLEPNSLVTQQWPRCCYVLGLAGLKESCPWMTILERQTGPTLEPASSGGREGVSTPTAREGFPRTCLEGGRGLFPFLFPMPSVFVFQGSLLQSSHLSPSCISSTTNFPSPPCYLPAHVCLSSLL